VANAYRDGVCNATRVPQPHTMERCRPHAPPADGGIPSCKRGTSPPMLHPMHDAPPPARCLTFSNSGGGAELTGGRGGRNLLRVLGRLLCFPRSLELGGRGLVLARGRRASLQLQGTHTRTEAERRRGRGSQGAAENGSKSAEGRLARCDTPCQ